MKHWYFEEGVHKPAAEWAREGKPEWPDLMVVQMSKEAALRLLTSLAAQLQHETVVELLFTGRLDATKE